MIGTEHPDCPEAYGGCTCHCHRSPGFVHCVPCCGPGRGVVAKRLGIDTAETEPASSTDAAAEVEVAKEREACAKLMELTRAELLLMAGEMTAQELRTVRAVLTNRAWAIRERSKTVSA